MQHNLINKLWINCKDIFILSIHNVLISLFFSFLLTYLYKLDNKIYAFCKALCTLLIAKE